MQCIEQMQPQRRGRQRSGSDADTTKDEHIDLPLEDVALLNENLVKWHKDSTKRMKNVSSTVNKLQVKLEDLDEYHAQAQEHAMAQKSNDRTEIDHANDSIRALKQEVDSLRKEVEAKNGQIVQLKQNSSKP